MSSKSKQRLSLGPITGTAILAVVMFALLAITVLSQVPPPPRDEGSRRAVRQRVVLTQKSADAAREYLDLIKELQELARDYQHYLAEYERPAIDTMVHSLLALQEQLAVGKLPSNPEKLAVELARQAELAEERAKYVKESTEIFPMQLYKLLRSLRRDLTGLETMVADEIAPQLKELTDQQERIRAFVAYSMSGEVQQVETQDDGSQVYVFLVQQDGKAPAAYAYKIDSLRALEDKYQQHKVVVLPSPPKPPKVPKAPESVGYGPSEGGREESSEASFRVRNSETPIVIRSTVGDIEILPSDDDMLYAEFSVGLTARSATQERQLLDQVSFRAIGSSRPCSVVVDIPDLRGPDAQLTHSSLRVTVPRNNPIMLAGMGGTISVRDIDGMLKIEAVSATIELSELGGKVVVRNNRGFVNGSVLRQPVEIYMSHGGVYITEASAGLEIENAYADVTVSESRGFLRIRNQGAVQVLEHIGDLTIENQLGVVSASDIRGKVLIRNSNQMTELSDINGTVTVDARFGGLTASAVEGPLNVVVRQGSVNLENVSGPLSIQVEGGSIWALFDGKLSGPSSITSNGGSIWLTVSEASDLLIKAQSTGGSVHSDLPARMTNSGGATLAEIKTGGGYQALSVTGTGSSIHIAAE